MAETCSMHAKVDNYVYIDPEEKITCQTKVWIEW
jgi:hypothetical protein